MPDDNQPPADPPVRSSELLACPFCGGPANVDRDVFCWSVSYRVGCSLCRCKLGTEFATGEEAARAWNYRAVKANSEVTDPNGLGFRAATGSGATTEI